MTFAWGARLHKLTPEEASASPALARLVDRSRIDEAAAHASAVLGRPVEIAHVSASVGGLDPAGAVLHASDRSCTLSVGVDGPSGLALAGVVFGATVPPVTTGEIGARAQGALAALLLAVLRRMGPTPRPFRVVDAGADGPLVTLTVHALVGSAPVEVRVATPLPHARPSTGELASLGAVPLTLPVALTKSVALSLADVAALTPGRALMLGDTDGRPLDVALVPARGERGVRIRVQPSDASLGARGRAVVTGEAFAAPLAMDPDSSSPLTEALREAELTIRVEVTSVTLPASAWAALREGDVVTTDTPVGSAVVLRAGGVAFAEGELCELSGHLAVRITKRAPSP